MPFSRAVLGSAVVLMLGSLASAAQPGPNELALTPTQFDLHGRTARQRLLLTATDGGQAVDLTRKAVFHADPSGVVRQVGHATPPGEGRSDVRADPYCRSSGWKGGLHAHRNRAPERILGFDAASVAHLNPSTISKWKAIE